MTTWRVAQVVSRHAVHPTFHRPWRSPPGILLCRPCASPEMTVTPILMLGYNKCWMSPALRAPMLVAPFKLRPTPDLAQDRLLRRAEPQPPLLPTLNLTVQWSTSGIYLILMRRHGARLYLFLIVLTPPWRKAEFSLLYCLFANHVVSFSGLFVPSQYRVGAIIFKD